MIFDSQIEKLLVDIGFDRMSMEQKNELITMLAKREEAILSQITEEYILGHHKKLKSDMLSEKCDEVIVTGFKSSNGHIYRMKLDDQVNFYGQALELLLFDKEAQVVPWLTEDVGYIKHTRDEWLYQVCREAFVHKRTQLFKYNELKTRIANAKTHEEIVTVDWDKPLELSEE